MSISVREMQYRVTITYAVFGALMLRMGVKNVAMPQIDWRELL